VGGEAGGDGGGEAVAIDRQGRACGHLVRIAGGQDQRAAAAHLGMQEADSVELPVVGAERVRADQFGQVAALVGGRSAAGAHLVQDDVGAGLGRLPGRLGTGQAAADDMDGVKGHGRLVRAVRMRW
jgi:hypothetical protein